MKKIVLTAVYFGVWPCWFPAFLASCAANPEIDWLVITDCEIEGLDYSNIRFVPMALEAFNLRASEALGIDVKKKPYTHDDIRPAYGHVLRDFYEGYDFWGHVDVDVVWGCVRKFVTDSILESCDILSSRQNAFAGHFTLYRNNSNINSIYRSHPDWQRAMGDEKFHHFNEREMGIFFKYRLPKDLKRRIRTSWIEPVVLDWWELFWKRKGWVWQDGQLYDGSGKEHMYMHFMTWKPYMKHIDFKEGETPKRFRITHGGIWSKPMTMQEKICEQIPLRFAAESYARYIAWYWVDRNKWIRWIRPGQHAKRADIKESSGKQA